MDLSRQESLLKRPSPPALVVGAGATGFHVAHQLLGLGCQRVEIWDHDTIEESNLNRQLYGMEGIGENKAEYLVSMLERAAHGSESEQTFIAVPKRLDVFDIEPKDIREFGVIFNTTDNLYHHGQFLRKLRMWLDGPNSLWVRDLIYISPRMSAFDAEVFVCIPGVENDWAYFHTKEEWVELEARRSSCTSGDRAFNPAIVTTSVLTAAMAVQQLVNHLNREPVAQWLRMDLESFKIEQREFWHMGVWPYGE